MRDFLTKAFLENRTMLVFLIWRNLILSRSMATTKKSDWSNDASLSFIIENALHKLKSSASTNKGSVSLDKTRHVSTVNARDDRHDATGPRSTYPVDNSPNTSSHTTQIFIHPCGDWTKRLYQELSLQAQQSAIWMRGPYVSPYAIATYFSRLVMVASGIGITPALGG